MSWLSLFIFLVMLGIIFFQTIHGLFSALIMATLCVVCGTLALGLHEVLANDLLYGLLGDYSYAISMAALFVVPLIAFRVLLDKIIPRSTLLPSLLDRGGATVLGIITGMVTAGVLAISIQMLPWGGTIMGFDRIDADGDVHAMWLGPDEFTVNLCGGLAGSTLGNGPSFFADHPDFLTELYWFRNAETSGSNISVPEGSVSFEKKLGYTPAMVKAESSGSGRRNSGLKVDPLDGPAAGHKWMVVGIKVSADGKDSDGKYRASATQARVVGTTGDDETVQYTLCGFGSNQENVFVSSEGWPSWGNTTGRFDLVFEVPDNFKPLFVEYKRSGRVDLPATTGELPVFAPGATSVSSTVQTSAPPRNNRGSSGGGATSPVRPSKQPSHFGDDMPILVKRYTGNADVGSGGLQGGHVVLKVDLQDPGSNANADPEQTQFESFAVPSGMRLLQLDVEAVHANTELAGAMNLTRRVLQQYRVIDDSGQDYWPAGCIAECDSQGDRLMEVQYSPDEAELGRALKRFKKIKYDELKGDYRFVLLFIVPPNKHITKFDVGRREIDISDQNLQS